MREGMLDKTAAERPKLDQEFGWMSNRRKKENVKGQKAKGQQLDQS